MRPSRSALYFLACVLLLGAAPVGTGCRHEPAEVASRSDSAAVYAFRSATPDGTGKFYMGREISKVMGHHGAEWLERPSREAQELPNRVVQALSLDSANVVADIGAGTGYFTFRISPRVPDGRVLAVDIQPEMLDLVSRRAKELGVANVRPVLGRVDNPNLPADSVDVVLLVDAYHEFSHPHEMMRNVVRSLKPDGRVVLVEYRGEDSTVPIKPLHKMTEAQAREEMEAVGLAWRETKSVLPQQHIMIFEKALP